MNEEVRQAAEAAARDPASYTWLTYSWVALMSAWGGLVRFLNSMRERNESVKSALVTLAIGLITSTFVGVLTFYACELGNFDKLTTAICIAITGHMGGEAIRLFRFGLITRLKAAWLAAFNPEKPND